MNDAGGSAACTLIREKRAIFWDVRTLFYFCRFFATNKMSKKILIIYLVSFHIVAIKLKHKSFSSLSHENREDKYQMFFFASESEIECYLYLI